MTVSTGESVRSRGIYFRNPEDLSASPTPLHRVLVVGSCFGENLAMHVKRVMPDCAAEFVLSSHAELPAAPPSPAKDYDCQLVYLPFRSVMNEESYASLSYGDVDGWRELFESAKQRVSYLLRIGLKWHRDYKIPTFVANFLVPQANTMGRTFGRYDLRNPVYFVEEVNRFLASEMEGQDGLYLLDVDQVSASFGRQYVQDDSITSLSHGSILTDFGYDHDMNRIEAGGPPSSHFDMKTMEFFDALWLELKAIFRTIRRIDEVKLVIIDLDDTLWRGVAAEEGLSSAVPREGWPLGFQETLHYLKRRGVLLAIASKNDEGRIRELWPELCGKVLRLEDFAAIRINWNTKSDNIAEIMRDVNLLPGNVVFIDDNPVERAAAKARFPDIRVLGSNPYVLRRILLWSAETQVAFLTEESSRRTEMIQAQVNRDTTRQGLSSEEFIATLGVTSKYEWIDRADHPRFKRSFELLNKTNQFNTTGVRWLPDEIDGFFRDGGRLFAFEVSDKFADYGLVGVVMVEPARDCLTLRQFVMSCRVFGLGVDLDAIAALIAYGKSLPDPARSVGATVTDTDKNMPCRDVFEKAGFALAATDGPSKTWVHTIG